MAPLQQIIEAMVQPLGIVWILSLIGLVANLLKRRWLTAIAFGAMAVLMFVFGSTPVPSLLLARLEKPYAAAGVREREREGRWSRDQGPRTQDHRPGGRRKNIGAESTRQRRESSEGPSSEIGGQRTDEGGRESERESEGGK